MSLLPMAKTERERSLVVSEVFGPTIQGEGPNAGSPAVFLRLMGCNQQCTFCDTPYTWDAERFDLKKEGERLTVGDVTKLLLNSRTIKHATLVVSGGEPLLQQPALINLLGSLRHEQLFENIELETAGTIEPNESLIRHVDQFNVSPKLASSGNDFRTRFNQRALMRFQATYKAVFKFVVTCPDDIEEIAKIQAQIDISPRRIWLMPEGITPEDQLLKMRWVAESAIACGYKFTARLHTLCWGSERGR